MLHFLVLVPEHVSLSSCNAPSLCLSQYHHASSLLVSVSVSYHAMHHLSAYLSKSQYQHQSLQVVTPEDDEGTVSALVLPDTGTITPSVSILGPSVLRARLGAQVSESFSGQGRIIPFPVSGDPGVRSAAQTRRRPRLLHLVRAGAASGPRNSPRRPPALPGNTISHVIILHSVKQYCIRLSQERRDVASVSRLVLGAARLGDGGLYTCSPGNTISGVTILYPALQPAPASATPPSRSASSQVGGICCSTFEKENSNFFYRNSK